MTKEQAQKLRQAFEAAKKMQRAEDERRMEESDRRSDQLRIEFKSAGATRKRITLKEIRELRREDRQR